ncbi:hypothetical protein D9M68_775500 [compost metagenome]
MDQHAGTDLVVQALQGALELLAKVDGALFDHHRAYRQHLIAFHVQAAGFQVEHHQALLAQRGVAEGDRFRQAHPPIQMFLEQGRPVAAEPGELTHS